jgi:hypothetical protein
VTPAANTFDDVVKAMLKAYARRTHRACKGQGYVGTQGDVYVICACVRKRAGFYAAMERLREQWGLTK